MVAKKKISKLRDKKYIAPLVSYYKQYHNSIYYGYNTKCNNELKIKPFVQITRDNILTNLKKCSDYDDKYHKSLVNSID